MLGVRVLKVRCVLLLVLAAACTKAPVPYPDQIAAWHAEKDRFMKSSESPVPADQRASFPPLPYFPVDPEYRVPAMLQPEPGSAAVEMATSTGKRRQKEFHHSHNGSDTVIAPSFSDPGAQGGVQVI